jgi:hypothetical protein
MLGRKISIHFLLQGFKSFRNFEVDRHCLNLYGKTSKNAHFIEKFGTFEIACGTLFCLQIQPKI